MNNVGYQSNWPAVLEMLYACGIQHDDARYYPSPWSRGVITASKTPDGMHYKYTSDRSLVFLWWRGEGVARTQASIAFLQMVASDRQILVLRE